MSKFPVEQKLSTWRKVAISTWRRGDDPTIYGFLDLDATAALSYVARIREATGARATLTHVIGKAAAQAFAAYPECNAFPSMGRLRRRPTIDVFFQVDVGGGKNLSGAKVESADRLSIVEIAKALEARAQRIREKEDTALQRTQQMLFRLPSVMLAPMLRATEVAMYDFGIDLSSVGVPFDPFGTVMITNVGMFGVERALAPLVPISRVPALLTVGAVQDRVVARDGEMVIRKMVTLGCTFDHRVTDGFQLSKMAKVLRQTFENPERELGDVAYAPAQTS